MASSTSDSMWPMRPHLGMCARGHHHGCALPLRHQRARKAHAQAVAQRGIGGHGLGVLVHRHRFAGEGGFVHPGCGHRAAAHRQAGGRRGQLHHIAGHQVGGIQVGGVAIAQHHRVRAEQVADGLQRRLGLAFLHKPDHPFQHHPRRQSRPCPPVAHEAVTVAAISTYSKQVVELAQQAHQRTGSGRSGQAVGAVGRQALLGLGLRSALRRGGQRPVRHRWIGRATPGRDWSAAGGGWRLKGSWLSEQGVSWLVPACRSCQGRFLTWISLPAPTGSAAQRTSGTEPQPGWLSISTCRLCQLSTVLHRHQRARSGKSLRMVSAAKSAMKLDEQGPRPVHANVLVGHR